jgi:hypothetical protein
MGLEENIRAYKDRLDRVPQRQKLQKGTRQEVGPTAQPDRDVVQQAVRDNDYAAFRTATLSYEEPLRKRIGRWLERYPNVARRIDRDLKVSDVVEAVFLAAFEGHDRRPMDLRYGDWLESLIDPAVKTLGKHGDRELENINLVRSAVEAEGGPRVD